MQNDPAQQIEDEVRFAVAVGELAAAFGQTAEPTLVDAYFMALEDLGIDAIEKACKDAIRTCEFFPRPVGIRRLTSPDAKSRALDAWPEVMKAAGGNGTITDPIAAKAVQNMGGVKRLGRMEEEILREWGRKRFEELYQDACEQIEIRQRLGYDEPKRLGAGIAGLIGDMAGGKAMAAQTDEGGNVES